MAEEDLRTESIERLYNELVIAGLVRLEKRDYPRDHLEDELTNYMAWEIHSLFGTLVDSTEVYRNTINGNYIVKLSTERKGRSASNMDLELKLRLSKVVFGDGNYYGIKAMPVAVKEKDNLAEIQLELVMPPVVRYTNIKNYLERECDRLAGNALRIE